MKSYSPPSLAQEPLNPACALVFQKIDLLLAVGKAQQQALQVCLDTFVFFTEHGYVTDLAVKALEEVGAILLGVNDLEQKPPSAHDELVSARELRRR